MNVAPLSAESLAIELAATDSSSKIKILSPIELLSKPRQAWLVDEVIPARGLGVVYGPPGSGKTFVMTSLAFAILQGDRWFGRRVRKTSVLYIAAEGNLRDRLAAILRHHARKPDAISDLGIIDQSINFLDPAAPSDLTAALSWSHLTQPGLIIVDTLNRSMPGGNENSSEHMSAVVSAAQQLSNVLMCPLIFVHHPGKDGTRGARGHSSLLGALDFELEVARDAGSETRRIRVSKQRDANDGYDLGAFQLDYVELGLKRDYDPGADATETYGSCVVTSLDTVPEKAAHLSRGAKRALGFLHEAFDHGAGQIIPADIAQKAQKLGLKTGQNVCLSSLWRDLITKHGGISESDKPDSERKAFVRARNDLESRKIIISFLDFVWLADKPDKTGQNRLCPAGSSKAQTRTDRTQP